MLIHNPEDLPLHNQRTKRETLAALISDMVSNLMYYDRKGDDEFPRFTIENMIEGGEVTIDEMVECFRAHLTRRMQDH